MGSSKLEYGVDLFLCIRTYELNDLMLVTNGLASKFIRLIDRVYLGERRRLIGLYRGGNKRRDRRDSDEVFFAVGGLKTLSITDDTEFGLVAKV